MAPFLPGDAVDEEKGEHKHAHEEQRYPQDHFLIIKIEWQCDYAGNHKCP